VTVSSPIDRYRRHFDATWPDDAPIGDVRFVVVDLETTGLDPATDAIVTIGAVAVENEEIVLEDSLSLLLKVAHNTSAVAVHGVTHDRSLAGFDEPEAIERLLDYLKDGVIVGHHIGHDITAVNTACERHWGASLLNRSLDTMDLTLHLERDGAFAARPAIRRFTLDALCEMFSVVPHDRHTAAGDAFITAQIFLRLVRLAPRFGRGTLERICEPFDVEEPAIGTPAV
jgi:DNA polymerase-3 subunit epsilon